MKTSVKTIAYMCMGLSGLMAGGSMLIFGLFLFVGPFTLIPLSLSTNAALFFNGALCLLFFSQHSGMVRRSFQHRLARNIPEAYIPSIYAIASGAVLFLVVVFWQTLPGPWLTLGGAPRLLMRMLFLVSMAGLAWGNLVLKNMDPMGLRAIAHHIKGRSPQAPAFVVRGPYRWVRHPLYAFSLLLIWATPDFSPDRILFNGLWTIWISIGILLEERDLLSAFGEDYRHYQQKVPMVFPIRLWRQ